MTDENTIMILTFKKKKKNDKKRRKAFALFFFFFVGGEIKLSTFAPQPSHRLQSRLTNSPGDPAEDRQARQAEVMVTRIL